MGFLFNRKGGEDAKVASMGSANKMYFNKDLNMWVKPGDEEAKKKEFELLNAPPPPPSSQTAPLKTPFDPNARYVNTKYVRTEPQAQSVAPPSSMAVPPPMGGCIPPPPGGPGLPPMAMPPATAPIRNQSQRSDGDHLTMTQPMGHYQPLHHQSQSQEEERYERNVPVNDLDRMPTDQHSIAAQPDDECPSDPLDQSNISQSNDGFIGSDGHLPSVVRAGSLEGAHPHPHSQFGGPPMAPMMHPMGMGLPLLPPMGLPPMPMVPPMSHISRPLPQDESQDTGPVDDEALYHRSQDALPDPLDSMPPTETQPQQVQSVGAPMPPPSMSSMDPFDCFQTAPAIPSPFMSPPAEVPRLPVVGTVGDQTSSMEQNASAPNITSAPTVTDHTTFDECDVAYGSVNGDANHKGAPQSQISNATHSHKAPESTESALPYPEFPTQTSPYGIPPPPIGQSVPMMQPPAFGLPPGPPPMISPRMHPPMPPVEMNRPQVPSLDLGSVHQNANKEQAPMAPAPSGPTGYPEDPMMTHHFQRQHSDHQSIAVPLSVSVGPYTPSMAPIPEEPVNNRKISGRSLISGTESIRNGPEGLLEGSMRPYPPSIINTARQGSARTARHTYLSRRQARMRPTADGEDVRGNDTSSSYITTSNAGGRITDCDEQIRDLTKLVGADADYVSQVMMRAAKNKSLCSEELLQNAIEAGDNLKPIVVANRTSIASMVKGKSRSFTDVPADSERREFDILLEQLKMLKKEYETVQHAEGSDKQDMPSDRLIASLNHESDVLTSWNRHLSSELIKAHSRIAELECQLLVATTASQRLLTTVSGLTAVSHMIPSNTTQHTNSVHPSNVTATTTDCTIVGEENNQGLATAHMPMANKQVDEEVVVDLVQHIPPELRCDMGVQDPLIYNNVGPNNSTEGDLLSVGNIQNDQIVHTTDIEVVEYPTQTQVSDMGFDFLPPQRTEQDVPNVQMATMGMRQPVEAFMFENVPNVPNDVPQELVQMAPPPPPPQPPMSQLYNPQMSQNTSSECPNTSNLGIELGHSGHSYPQYTPQMSPFGTLPPPPPPQNVSHSPQMSQSMSQNPNQFLDFGF